MKITDLKCAIIGRNPIIRIITDEGINGYGEVEASKPYLKPFILFFRDALIGEDPTNVERVMLKIRQLRTFSIKPWFGHDAQDLGHRSIIRTANPVHPV